ncbi:MAG: hypothetical protein J2P17_08670 [Mycobacterium sp.]|nr:hypothetical protein [Mycobacterium sp.]
MTDQNRLPMTRADRDRLMQEIADETPSFYEFLRKSRELDSLIIITEQN